MKLLAVDLARFRAMLGSGEEKFCAKVLRSVPPLAERLDLVKEWKRAVTSLVLGEAGEALAAREPFAAAAEKAGPGLSLAFASILEGYSEPATAADGALADGPLFGLEADGELVRWGRAGNAVALAGRWTDGEPA